MNSNSGEKPKFEVPPVPSGYEAQRQLAMENRPDEEGGAGKQQSPHTNTALAPPVPPTITIPVVTKADDTDDSSSPALTKDLPADDVDLIEKQWVERAKAIVKRTQNDPYTQKKEISKAGADYIKKRFNKSIPTDDAVRT